MLALALLVCAASAVSVAAAERERRLLVLGDSLAAGWGLDPGDSFSVRLETRLRALGHRVRVINGGVTGDTSAGGRARLVWALADKPDSAIVELGANDGLRGLDPAVTFANLDNIVKNLKAAGIRVLVAGMRAPPNLGCDYGAEFNAVFPRIAKKHGVALYPFFLAGAAARPGLNQSDGMHPNQKGVAVIVDLITPFVVRLLKSSAPVQDEKILQ